jgi:tRNA pseudouridine38-40 synthase
VGPTRQNLGVAHTGGRAQRLGTMVVKQTFALLLAYDGQAFRGWQKQPGMATVQGALEDALRALLGKRHAVQGASRTDAGVHALGQVASFQIGRDPDLAALRLPEAVRLLRWARAHASFHARASSIGKRYRYDLRRFLPPGADWERARAALRGLDGLSHLSGLCSPAKEHKPAPPLTRWSLSDEGILEVTAAAFRKHEVRNLAGHLGGIALGLATPGSLRELAERSRPWMGARAPAEGLTLVEVMYPRELDPFRPATS